MVNVASAREAPIPGGITSRCKEARYKEVRGLSRGLQILVALNANTQTRATISMICRQTGLHRTTVKRLLETLRHEQFAAFDEVTGTYSLSSTVKQLSAGFTDDEELVEIARPILASFDRQVIWPTELCTFDIDAMTIRATTQFRNSVFFDKLLPGMRLPVLLTAAGRAYFFACDPAKREEILAVLSAKDGDEGDLARDPGRLGKVEQEVARRGCAVGHGEWSLHPNRAGLAVAILGPGGVLGSINVVFSPRAMPVDKAVELNLPRLSALAGRIAAGMTAQPERLARPGEFPMTEP